MNVHADDVPIELCLLAGRMALLYFLSFSVHVW